jgi:hypothetical protein
MLTLTGLLRAATTLGGGLNKKTGEIVPLRSVLQIETVDGRGLVQMNTITVPDLSVYESRVGLTVALTVRAWSTGTPVNFMYEPPEPMPSHVGSEK